MITIDPVSTANSGAGRSFCPWYNEFCSDHGGVPLLNQTPFLTRAQVEKALGDRWRDSGKARHEYDPGKRLLNSLWRPAGRTASRGAARGGARSEVQPSVPRESAAGERAAR